jgi:CheY-like chemotaxis protein
MSIKSLLLSILLTTLNLSADVSSIAKQDDDFTMWIALFGLGLIGIMALFLSSEKVKKVEEKQKEEELLNKEHQTQDAIVSKMGESIYDIAKESIAKSNITKSENQLLAITTNLIDFLRIKSKKVTIDNQALKLSNLLNDVSGTLKANAKGKEFELIYNIEKDLSKELHSDTLNMSKVLVNIFLYCVENNSSELILDVSRTSLHSHNDQLSFSVYSNLKIDAESEVDIFSFNYNEETEEYDSLGLYIAKELAQLMKGDLIARNAEDKNLEFVFSIPYVEGQQEPLADKYSSTQKLKPKSILLIDSSPASAKSIEAILLSLGHDVKIIDKDIYTSYFEYFDIYDLILIDEKLFTNKTVAQLENTNSKIIAISNLFGSEDGFPNASIADAKISKPLTIWQMTNVLYHLFADIHDTSKITNNGVVNSGTAIVHRNSFQDTRNISLSSFSKYHNKRVLLVEDNAINQKVFIGVLGKSNMKIFVAKHGKEALKILETEKDIDIIFMDINMPVMDGYTTSIKIREEAKYDAIPIIALSALTSSDEVAKMFTSGMNGYMAKPLQKEKLYTVFSIFIENLHVIPEETTPEEKTQTINLEGLNVTIGISKSSSSKIFYKEILTEFIDAYGETDKLFEKLVNDFRYEQLRIVCIDIRGLTGTIGTERLNNIVTDMLRKLSLKKYDFIPELVKQYSMELKVVNKSIKQYLG